MGYAPPQRGRGRLPLSPPRRWGVPLLPRHGRVQRRDQRSQQTMHPGDALRCRHSCTTRCGGSAGRCSWSRSSVGCCCVYCTGSGVTWQRRRPDQRWRWCWHQCDTSGKGLPWGCWALPRSCTLRPMPERCGKRGSCRLPSRNRGGQSWTRRRVGLRRCGWASVVCVVELIIEGQRHRCCWCSATPATAPCRM